MIRRTLPWCRLRSARVPAFWEVDHPPSLGASYCQTSIEDLHCSFQTGRLQRADYIDYIVKRRALFRGTKGIVTYPSDYNPLCSLDKKNVIGYDRNDMDLRSAWVKLRRIAVNDDKLFDKYSTLKQNFLRGKLSAKGIKDYRKLKTKFDHPLHSLVYSIKCVVAQPTRDPSCRLLKAMLDSVGAHHFGYAKGHNIAILETDVPHPFHRDIHLGGSSGALALSVATGLAQFGLGTNWCGSSQISAGLLGCTGLVFGGNVTTTLGVKISEIVGLITRTPHDTALVCAVLLNKPVDEIRSLLSSAFSRNRPQPTIGYLSHFLNVKSVSYPGLGAQSVAPRCCNVVGRCARGTEKGVLVSGLQPNSTGHFNAVFLPVDQT